ncbi:MAG: fumarylacetoacetate hydrolase family protein [Proteobacteria bacterium]|nr:fumarylacetoacetate hydrolase family protein [Pseudomonadota bacterium]MDA1309902.1 fumarylacetoacetate hydrolase family protein [Pseudomonadota bacterium]
MLTKQQTSQAAALIWQSWRDGAVIADLPDALRPADRTEGYAIQAHYQTLSGQPIFGWKIAATSEAGQQHIGVDGPIAGRLLAEHVFQDGATLAFGHNRMAVAEAEFAFRMATDLPPRAVEYSVEEVLAAVGSLHPAIEIPDSRFQAFERAGAAQLIADNACTHDFVLGPAMPALWRDRDLTRHAVTATVEGKVIHEGIGANVLGDPRIALAWMANELSRYGMTLGAGHVVTTGTCAVPLPVGPGDRVMADYGDLGRVSMRFA